MPSPLADIDWTNLDSAEMTTVVKLLLQALQERANIAMVNMDGTYDTIGNPTDQQASNYFPYKTNTPDYPLSAGDPLIDFTTEVQDLLIKCLAYADIAKWDDADTNGTGGVTLYTLGMTADAPGTYDNRLFEVTGYTSYPDLSVYAGAEVKKLYDMVTTFKWVIREHGEANDDYMIFTGELDVESDSDLVADIDGADWYGITDKTNYEAVTNTTPYSDFKTGNSNLFASGSTTYDESVGGGTYPPNYEYPYRLRFSRLSGSGNYGNWISAFRVTYVADWTDVQSGIGISNKPKSYKNQQNILSLTNTYPTGEDTNWVWPKTTTGVNERYYTTTTLTENGAKDEIEVDDDLTAVTLPTNVTDIAANEVVQITARFYVPLRRTFLEEWDADGSFVYFTPP